MSELIKVFLIGFSGTGKSSVVDYIKNNYSYEVCDIDDYIVKNTSKSLVNIFQYEGEAVFRTYEEQAIICSIKEQYQIIAPGGGAITHKNSANLMSCNGKIIYLKASPAVIYERIKDDNNRPLLREKSFQYIEKMISDRSPVYEKYANYTIDINELTLEAVAKKVVEYYESINRTR